MPGSCRFRSSVLVACEQESPFGISSIRAKKEERGRGEGGRNPPPPPFGQLFVSLFTGVAFLLSAQDFNCTLTELFSIVELSFLLDIRSQNPLTDQLISYRYNFFTILIIDFSRLEIGKSI